MPGCRLAAESCDGARSRISSGSGKLTSVSPDGCDGSSPECVSNCAPKNTAPQRVCTARLSFAWQDTGCASPMLHPDTRSSRWEDTQSNTSHFIFTESFH